MLSFYHIQSGLQRSPQRAQCIDRRTRSVPLSETTTGSSIEHPRWNLQDCLPFHIRNCADQHDRTCPVPLAVNHQLTSIHRMPPVNDLY